MRLEKIDASAYRLFAGAIHPFDPYLRPPHLHEFHIPAPETFQAHFKPLWMLLLYTEEVRFGERRILLLQVAEIEAQLREGTLARLRVRADEHLRVSTSSKLGASSQDAPTTQDLPAEEGTLKAFHVTQSHHHLLTPNEGGAWYENTTAEAPRMWARLEAMEAWRLDIGGATLDSRELTERLRVYAERVRAENLELEPLEMQRETPLGFTLKTRAEEMRRMCEETR
ncbi:MAG: hypothetical protein HY558_01375 [Euryarchaeota archaeon]|nr:hypothetical protein [Euryarchaeota archaeon]